MPVTKTSISIQPDIAAAMQARGDNLSGAISQHLGRYLEALRRARAEIKPQFDGRELAMLCDVCNGTLFEAHAIPLLYAEIEDSLSDGYAAKWEVDGPALVSKLRGLSYIQQAAIVDAVERWWNADDPRPPFVEILK
jgi:hypothetical protein